MYGQGAQVQGGWIENIKNALNPSKIMERLNLSRGKLLELGLFLGLGFVAGFLLKKYAKYLVIFILLIIGFVFLDRYGIIKFAIDWNKVQEVVGMKTVAMSGDSLLHIIWEWIKTNVGIVLSFSVGFLLGLKVG